MANTPTTGPISDFPTIGEPRTATDPHGLGQLGRKIIGEDFEATLVRANAAAGIPDGAIVGLTSALAGGAGGHDVEPLTIAIVTALSASDREALKMGFWQGLATDNQVGWMVTKLTNSAAADLQALAGAAITAGAQAAVSATAGEIVTSATGNYDIIGFSVVVDPGGGNVFSTWSCDDLRLNPTINP